MKKINYTELFAMSGDITKFSVDVIVNAANESLLGGGGVDGAIHKAAGPMLLKECANYHGCNPGEVKGTYGYNLPATYVLHAVGPRWNKDGGNKGKVALLKSCYRESMKMASILQAKSIAFPCISTGIFGFPKDKASLIAINEVISYLLNYETTIRKVYFVCFEDESLLLYKNILGYKR